MRCLIVHNPQSGPRSDEIYAFAHALAEAGDEVVFRYLGAHMEPPKATADALSFDCVVVSGGDGTVSNVLDELRNTQVPILVFPSGTANLFFNNIGNAPEPAALAQACRQGRTVDVDMGELSWVLPDGSTGRHGFIIIAGTGFDAEIMRKAEANHGDMGEIAYMLSALLTPAPPVAHFVIKHDGHVDELDGIGCMVGNTSILQNEINLFPDCRMDDGLIDIAVIQPGKTVELLPTVLAGVLDPAGKGLGRPNFTFFQAREVEVSATPSLGMEFDGELIEGTPQTFTARVLPRALRLIVDEFSHLAYALEHNSEHQ
ncbi:NAD(+)/NADH kinase [Collinsella sp. zg1085]|uniref:diacylglycerol/lipid kinase family protein n=1 Tax=Collinsella sp. zg1085 TaxID=2844380 RepID=UPI001C0B19C8|nr:diacylglycerol kinase family protein [Collinsella sp. zg1085]QWT17998.1 NAD(+)/NADH kinase [Collinsella sp. zg1085]